MATRAKVTPAARSHLLAQVDELSGQRVMSCYQCGKCTAGCPMASHVAKGPRHVMRAVQLGRRDAALDSEMIWACLACQTCTVRCPREIDVAGVMESLRHLAIAERRAPAASEIDIFQRVFLASVKRGGRVYELGIGGMYNLLTRRPLQNVALLPKLLAKRKLSLVPERAKGTAEVEAIFERVAAIEGRSAAPILDSGAAAKSAVAAAAVGIGVLAGAKTLRGRGESK